MLKWRSTRSILLGLEKQMAATQAQVDALTATVTGYGNLFGQDPSFDFSAIEAELAAASTANPGVDLSGLEAAISNVSGQLVAAQTADDAAATPTTTPAP